jgi:xylose dehydrogenase (NAD/NADP)
MIVKEQTMANQILNWGFLSTARINRALIPPLKSSKRNRLSAVASRSTEHAEKYAEEWNIPNAYGSYEALLADPAIDVIYISIPNHLHAEWAIKACEAGKHILCEKPLAVTVDEVDAMIAAAKENRVILQEAFMYRHHPQTMQVKTMIEEGKIGQLRYFYGDFSFTLSREDDIRMIYKEGGGSLYDVGCYPLSYIRYLTGTEPVEVYANQLLDAKDVDDIFVAQFYFPDHIFCQINSAFRLPFRTRIEIVGSEGSIILNNPYKPEGKGEIILRRGGKEQKISTQSMGLYNGEVENMADAILLNKAPCVSLEDSRGNIAAIQAMQESARLGKPIRLTV